MHRLFVALRPPPAIRAALIDAMDAVPGARWQDDEQLHVTVRFLGEVERPVAEDAALALSQVVAPALAARLSDILADPRAHAPLRAAARETIRARFELADCRDRLVTLIRGL